MKRRTLTKLMAVALALVASVAVLAITAFASGGSATISTESTNVSRGDTVEFSVAVTASEIKGLGVQLQYDDTLFDFVDITWSDCGVLFTTPYDSANKVTSGMFSMNPAIVANVNGEVLTFILTAKSDATITDASVSAIISLDGTALPSSSVTSAELSIICASGSHTWSGATCTAPKTCSTCGMTEGSSLGHDWGSATCQDPATCTRCGEASGDSAPHDFSRQVPEAAYLKEEAGCLTRAKYYYCCAYCDAVGENTYSYGEIPGHTGGTASCDQQAICDRCNLPYGDYAHSYVNENTDEAYLASPATCTSKALYYLSCTCGAVGTDTFEAGEIGTHLYVENAEDAYLATPATCSAQAIYYVSCSACGAAGTETFAAGATTPHNYTENADEAYLVTPAGCTTKNVYNVSCSDCGVAGTDTFEHGNAKGHTYGEQIDEQYLVSPATCTAKATYYNSCLSCGAAGTDTFETGELAAHSFDAAWKSDGDKHWKECACGAKSEEGAHSWDKGTVTKEATSKSEGKKTFTCKTCSDTKLETIPKLKSNMKLILIAGAAIAVVAVIAVVIIIVVSKKKSAAKKAEAESDDNIENADLESAEDSEAVADDAIEEALAEAQNIEADLAQAMEAEIAAEIPEISEDSADDTAFEAPASEADDAESKF